VRSLRALSLRLFGTFGRQRQERELAEELEAHLQAHIDDNRRLGMTSEEARRRALIALGGWSQTAEAHRERRGLPFVETTMQDLRYALRMFRKAPGFVATSLLTLALGIGANTAIFSVLNAVLLRPFDYPRPDRLMTISSQFPGLNRFWISVPEFIEYREWTHAFSSVGAYATGESNLTAPDRPERVRTMTASTDLFTTLGVAAHIGRTFDAGETRPGAAPVTVVSYGLWRSTFGSDPALVGTQIEVDGVRRTVVGIMPAGFDVADQRVQVWLPLTVNPAAANRANHFLYLIGRLGDGATPASARAELDTLLARWQETAGGTRGANGLLHAPNATDHRLRIEPLQAQVVGTARTAVWVLQGAVVLVLLIACANLSTLLLSRAESRRREFAVRTALGAGRLRLLRQSIAEGCLLSTVGAALGLAVAVAGIRALVAAFPGSLPRAGEISIDVPVLLFTLLVALGTGIVFGLAPALHLVPELTAATLKGGGQRPTTGRHAVRHALVVCEVALAVVLVVGAGLLLRTVTNLTRVDAGFNRTHLVTFAVSLPSAKYLKPVDRTSFYRRLIDQLSASPGVVNAAAMTGLPPRQDLIANALEIEGYQPSPQAPISKVDYLQEVTTGYVSTMGIPVLEGRAFQPSDADRPLTVLVNQTMARTFWPGQSAIGHRLRPCCDSSIPWLTIAGVLKDVKQGGVDRTVGTELYLNTEASAPRAMNVVLRTSLAPEVLAGTIQRIVAGLDPALPVNRLRAMADVFEEAIGRPRLLAELLTIFAAVALLLSTIGTYGLLSYMVAERRREIGIRMALGATRSSVLRMVVGQGVRLTLVGLAAGLTIALAAGRALTSLLFDVRADDPITMTTVVALIGGVALVACYLPGRSATRVDPMVAVRAD
jgi:predicted permease